MDVKVESCEKSGNDLPVVEDQSNPEDREYHSKKFKIFYGLVGLLFILVAAGGTILWLSRAKTPLLNRDPSVPPKKYNENSIVDNHSASHKVGSIHGLPHTQQHQQQPGVWILSSFPKMGLLTIIAIITVALVVAVSLVFCCVCLRSDQAKAVEDVPEEIEDPKTDEKEPPEEEPKSFLSFLMVACGWTFIGVLCLILLYVFVVKVFGVKIPFVSKSKQPILPPNVANPPGATQPPILQNPTDVAQNPPANTNDGAKVKPDSPDVQPLDADQVDSLFTLAEELRVIAGEIKRIYGVRMPDSLIGQSAIRNALICLYASKNPGELWFYASTADANDILSDLTSNQLGVPVELKRENLQPSQAAMMKTVLTGLKEHAQLCLDIATLAMTIGKTAVKIMESWDLKDVTFMLRLMASTSQGNLILCLNGKGDLEMALPVTSDIKWERIYRAESIFNEEIQNYGLDNVKKYYEHILKRLQLHGNSIKNQ